MLQPHGEIGNDTLVMTFPDQTVFRIPVSIGSSGQPAIVQLTPPPSERLNTRWSADTVISVGLDVLDDRGNLVQNPVIVEHTLL